MWKTKFEVHMKHLKVLAGEMKVLVKFYLRLHIITFL